MFCSRSSAGVARTALAVTTGHFFALHEEHGFSVTDDPLKEKLWIAFDDDSATIVGTAGLKKLWYSSGSPMNVVSVVRCEVTENAQVWLLALSSCSTCPVDVTPTAYVICWSWPNSAVRPTKRS